MNAPSHIDTVRPHTIFAGAALVALMVSSVACHSEGSGKPESSSSSHWFACRELGDCSSAPGAVACTQGYCVDRQGERVPMESPGLDAEEGAVESRDAALEAQTAAPEPDAGTTDAAVGREAGPSADGAAESGAASDPPVKLTLRVVDRYNNIPHPDAPVVFSDAQGRLVATLRTGADSTVHADLSASMVTTFRPSDGGGGSLTTIVGVQTGDSLQVYPPSPQISTTVPSYAASVPASARRNATVRVRGGDELCPVLGESMTLGAIIPVTDYRQCLRDDGQNALLAWIEGATTFADFEGFSWLKQLAKPVAPAQPSIQFMAYQRASRCDVSVRNLPEDSGVERRLFMWSGATSVQARELEGGFGYAAGFSDDLEARVRTGTIGRDYILRRRAAPSERIEFDYASLLPAPGPVQLVLLDNPPRIHLSWSMADSPGLDAASIELRGSFYSWTVLLPPSVRSITLPVLPEELGLNGSFLDMAQVQSLSYLASDTISDYSEFRNLQPDYSENLLERPLRARGQAQVTSWRYNNN
jgi:hypothetical protein